MAHTFQVDTPPLNKRKARTKRWPKEGFSKNTGNISKAIKIGEKRKSSRNLKKGSLKKEAFKI